MIIKILEKIIFKDFIEHLKKNKCVYVLKTQIQKMILLIIYLLLPLNIVISTTSIPKYETTTQIPTESDALSNVKNDIDNSRRNRRNTQPEVGTNLYLSQADTAPVRRAYQFPPKGLIQMLLNRNSLIDQRFVTLFTIFEYECMVII